MIDLKKSLLVSVCTLSTVVGHIALADQGPGGTGGGNSLKGKMIESYRVDPDKRLPGFTAAVNALDAKLGEFPDFATKLRETIDKQNWYLIPAEINELPESITGLRMKTDQCAYQNDTEIYISAPCLKRMQQPKDRNDLYDHENLMATLKTKDPRQIRDFIAYLDKHPGAKAFEIRNDNPNLQFFSNQMSKEAFQFKGEVEALVDSEVQEACTENVSDAVRDQDLKKALYSNRSQDRKDFSKRWVNLLDQSLASYGALSDETEARLIWYFYVARAIKITRGKSFDPKPFYPGWANAACQELGYGSANGSPKTTDTAIKSVPASSTGDSSTSSDPGATQAR